MRLRALSVSELNKYIKKILTSDPILNNITVKGEISNLKYHDSGHIYMSLKDSNSKVNCVMFKENAKKLLFQAENGIKVLVKGYISTFERDGQYQFYINEMEPDGIGALYLAFEQLKNKLEKKGYFDVTHKKKIPYLPKKIAVVTSPTGAAIRDIISVVKRRNPLIDIMIYPVLVQGENAGVQIAQAIDKINKNSYGVDLIIIGRGGGSIEELWAFNEEVVADQIYNSGIPIISAVGHETDYTISDFVSDLRAPTPSAAAEMAAPSILDIQYNMESRYLKLKDLVLSNIAQNKIKLELYQSKKLSSFVLDKLREERLTVDLFGRSLQDLTKQNLIQYKTKMVSCISKLEAMNPLATIIRGYALIFDQENQAISSVDNIKEGDNINIMLTDGYLSCSVLEKKKEDHIIESYDRFEIKKG